MRECGNWNCCRNNVCPVRSGAVFLRAFDECGGRLRKTRPFVELSVSTRIGKTGVMRQQFFNGDFIAARKISDKLREMILQIKLSLFDKSKNGDGGDWLGKRCDMKSALHALRNIEFAISQAECLLVDFLAA